MTIRAAGSERTARTQLGDGPIGPTSSALQTSELPGPEYIAGPPVDDLQTALAVLMIETSRDQRSVADKQREVATKAQEAAHAEKIAKMRELADDTFTQGLVDGVFQGISAAAQAGAACLSYSSTLKEIDSKVEDCSVKATSLARGAAVAARASKLLDASSKLTSASGTIWSAASKSAQERDRADIAQIDRDVDRAKGAVEGASSDSKRAQDDIRETINYVRQYLAAKTQAAQAAIIKG